MSKKSKQSPPAKQTLWLWIAGGVALVLLVAGLALWWNSTASAPTSTGSTAPQLVVDRTTIDEGEVKLDTPIRSAFRLSNTGSQPLQILGEPQVELVEGCWPPRAVVSSTTIEPGQEAELSLDYMMHAGMDGPHEFHVRLRTNDPIQPEVVLVVKSNWVP